MCFEALEVCVVEKWVECFLTPREKSCFQIGFDIGECAVTREIVVFYGVVFEVVEFEFYGVIDALEDAFDVCVCPFGV